MMKISKSFQKTLAKDLDNYKRKKLEETMGQPFNDKQWKFFREILVVGEPRATTNIDRMLDNLLRI